MARWHRQYFSLMMGACHRAATRVSGDTCCCCCCCSEPLRRAPGRRLQRRCRRCRRCSLQRRACGACGAGGRAGPHLRALTAAGRADENDVLARRHLHPTLELGQQVQRVHTLPRRRVEAGLTRPAEAPGRRLCSSLVPPALTGMGGSRRATRGPQGAARLSRQGVGRTPSEPQQPTCWSDSELATATHQAQRGGVSEPGLRAWQAARARLLCEQLDGCGV